MAPEGHADWREVTAEWVGGLDFVGKDGKGGWLNLGSAGEVAAQEGRLSPMELILIGLAGCTGIDVVSTLQKMRQNLSSLKLVVRGKRTENYPRVYTEIEVEYILAGDCLDPRAVERAIQLSKEKYCSVSAMLEKTARIDSRYRILQNDPGSAD